MPQPGNPGLWSPSYRCGAKTHEECNSGKWDNKWSMTIFARKVDTGEVVWAYQMTPFDQWDYDGVNENILTDMEIDGKKVKALTHFDRNGFAYVLDRTDGTLAAGEQIRDRRLGGKDRPQNRPADQGQGAFSLRGRREHVGVPFGHGRQGSTALCRRSQRAKHGVLPDQQLVHGGRAPAAHAHQPRHGLCVRQCVHVSREAWHHRQVQKIRRADRQNRMGDPGSLSELGRRAWSPMAAWCSTAASAVTSVPSIVTAARCYGAGSSVRASSAIPMTYKVDGKQYVSVYAGIGGWVGLPVAAGLDMNDKFGAIGATAIAKASGLNLIPQGGTLYTFRLSSN